MLRSGHFVTLSKSANNKLIEPCLYGPWLCVLCALGHSHVGIQKGFLQCVPIKLEAQRCPKCIGMLKTYIPSLEVRDRTQPLKNSPISLSLLHQTLQLAQCSSPDICQTQTRPSEKPNTEAIFRHSTEHASTAPESSGRVLYTPPSVTSCGLLVCS